MRHLSTNVGIYTFWQQLTQPINIFTNFSTSILTLPIKVNEVTSSHDSRSYNGALNGCREATSKLRRGDGMSVDKSASASRISTPATATKFKPKHYRIT